MKIDCRISTAGKRYILLVNFLLIFIINSCSSSLNDNPDDIILITDIRSNLEYLASDELEGREAATRGEKLAAEFLASELKAYGVKPYYNDYLQEYDLYSISADPDSKLDLLYNGGDKITLNYFTDFIADRRTTVTTNGRFNLVFAGYGICAPEFNYDDYANINAKGKIVIIADGEPGSSDTSYFNGNVKSKYSKESYKITEAKSHGAAGIIMIPSDFYFRNWEGITTYVKGKSVSLPDKKKEIMMELVFNEESLSSLFKDENFSWPEIKNMIYDNKPLQSFDVNKEIEVDVKMIEGLEKSYNVVGVIEGNDFQKKDEFIAIGSHYDHLGIRGGVVYNGADDNGSGTVAVLAVAKAFALTKKNERSILVVFHSGEEKGLLGSEYFTNNFDNINNIIAHINMDMVGRGSADTIYSVGAGKISSEFQKLVDDVNSQTVNFVFNYKFDDPSDMERIYYRSDHYNYAKHDIPIVFFYDYMMEDYHKPTDDIEKINFEKIKKTSILTYYIALKASKVDKFEKNEMLQLAN